MSDGPLLRGSTAAPSIGLGELFVRHARRDGRTAAVLRAVDHGDGVTVEVSYTDEGEQGPPPGSFRFADAREATVFATETIEALRFLGCEVAAS